MNLAYFQMLLQESIDNATSTQDLLSLSQALEKLLLGQIRTVATYTLLPNAATNEGLLVFVTADERLYWSTGSLWYSIVTDNRAYAWSWGCNVSGQLGTYDTTSRSSPVSVVGGFSDWCNMSGGCIHNVTVRTNGTTWTWGDNTAGELGDNTTTTRSSPVSVVGGFTDWCQASAGVDHTVAVRTSGSAWAWGCNSGGRLGDNSTTNRSSPVSVVGGFTNWCQVSAGLQHTVGIRSNGTAWAWGCNFPNVLGTGYGTTTSSPVSVVGGFTDWCQISASHCHTHATRTNGTIWGWGQNGNSRLGDNTTTDRSSPVSVVGGFTNWCGVSAAISHGVGIRTNGSVWSWGFGDVGRLGDGTTVQKSSPVSVVGGFTDWCRISANLYHVGALRTNGTTWLWGCNGQGRLGDNTTTDRSSPVSVVGGFSDWCQVAVGGLHTLALRIDDFV